MARIAFSLAIAGPAMRTINTATINTRANVSCPLAIRQMPKTELQKVIAFLKKELKVRFQARSKRPLPLEVPFAAHGFRAGPIPLGIEQGPLPSARRSCTRAGIMHCQAIVQIVGPSHVGSLRCSPNATDDINIAGHSSAMPPQSRRCCVRQLPNVLATLAITSVHEFCLIWQSASDGKYHRVCDPV